MTPEMAAMYSCVGLAIDRFARKCKEHPRFEEDPICVMATMQEQYKQSLADDILEQIAIEPKELMPAQPVYGAQTDKLNGHRNGKSHGRKSIR